MLRQYQNEIERLKQLLDNRQSTPLYVEDLTGRPEYDKTEDLDVRRDQLIKNYEKEMAKLKDLHENERNEKETILKQIESIKEDYKKNIEALNQQMVKKNAEKIASKEEILKRIEILKASMIGGEKIGDTELSERRKRKKLAAERRLRSVRS